MACTDVLLSSEQCVFLVLVVTLPYHQVPLHFVVTRQKSERLLHDGREAKREASILNLHVQTPPPLPHDQTDTLLSKECRLHSISGCLNCF